MSEDEVMSEDEAMSEDEGEDQCEGEAMSAKEEQGEDRGEDRGEDEDEDEDDDEGEGEDEDEDDDEDYHAVARAIRDVHVPPGYLYDEKLSTRWVLYARAIVKSANRKTFIAFTKPKEIGKRTYKRFVYNGDAMIFGISMRATMEKVCNYLDLPTDLIPPPPPRATTTTSDPLVVKAGRVAKVVKAGLSSILTESVLQKIMREVTGREYLKKLFVDELKKCL